MPIPSTDGGALNNLVADGVFLNQHAYAQAGAFNNLVVDGVQNRAVFVGGASEISPPMPSDNNQ